MNIGKTIEELRKKRGIKQYELAGIIKVTPTYMSMIESNKREPSASMLKVIAAALGVTPIIIIFNSLDSSDARDEKRDAFEAVYPLMRKMVDEYCINATEKNNTSS